MKKGKKEKYSKNNKNNKAKKLKDSGSAVYEVKGATLTSPTKMKKRTKSEKVMRFLNSDAIGMWADRKDMKDSVAWVNKMRAWEDSRVERMRKELEKEIQNEK